MNSNLGKWLTGVAAFLIFNRTNDMYFTVINKSLASKPETYDDIKVPYIIISISSHEESFCSIPSNEHCLDKLFLKFDDQSYKTQETLAHYEGVAYPMKEEEAVKLLEFVFKYKDEVNDIIAHCEAGISRSTAIALALSEILNGKEEPEKYIESLVGLQYANLLVKDLILKNYEKLRN